MSEWAAKRFWKKTEVESSGPGFTVTLDGRAVKTPAKTLLVVPTASMAEAVQAEWDAQEDVIDPRSMPVTRSANAALDKTTPQMEEVAGLISDYGETDLICYRADSPDSLIEAQNDAWDPMLDWAATTLNARLTKVSGVMFQPQPPEALEALRARVMALDPFELTAFHDLVSLSGSLVLGFAALERDADPDAIWRLSRIDEEFQIAQWGDDEEAAEVAEIKRAAFKHAHRFFNLSKN